MLIKTLGLVAIVIGVSETSAKDFPVTDQDQGNVLVICDFAAQSPLVTRDVRANIAQFCLSWQKRIEAANPPSQNPSPIAPSRPENAPR